MVTAQPQWFEATRSLFRKFLRVLWLLSKKLTGGSFRLISTVRLLVINAVPLPLLTRPPGVTMDHRNQKVSCLLPPGAQLAPGDRNVVLRKCPHRHSDGEQDDR